MGKITFILGALTRGVFRGLQPLPRARWSRRSAVIVHILRDLTTQLMAESGPVQQMLSAGPTAGPPSDLDFEERPLAGMRAIWLTPKARSGKTFLHLHGGGYVIGRPEEAMHFIGRMAHKSGAQMVSVEYRLAPQHPYPAAVDDALAAVRALLDGGVAPEDLFIGGDSAGGGLALATLLRLRDEGGPTLRGGILGSPWLQLNMTQPSVETNAHTDYLPIGIDKVWGAMYTGSTPMSDPGPSPGNAELAGLPPLLVMAGDAEMLVDQIRTGVAKASAAGVEVEFIVGDDAVHCWYMQPRLLPGPNVDDQIVAFLRR